MSRATVPPACEVCYPNVLPRGTTTFTLADGRKFTLSRRTAKGEWLLTNGRTLRVASAKRMPRAYLLCEKEECP